jgi:hypothetical protein
MPVIHEIFTFISRVPFGFFFLLRLLSASCYFLGELQCCAYLYLCVRPLTKFTEVVLLWMITSPASNMPPL